MKKLILLAFAVFAIIHGASSAGASIVTKHNAQLAAIVEGA